MKDAGLSHTSVKDEVTDQDKKDIVRVSQRTAN